MPQTVNHQPSLFRSLAAASSLLLAACSQAAPPAAPTDFTLKWEANGDFQCSWKDNSSDEEGFYIIYRTSPTGNYSIFTTVAANTSSYTDTLTSWPSCSYFQWGAVSFKSNGAEYSFSNLVTMTAPAIISSAEYTSGLVSTPFSHQITLTCSGTTVTGYSAADLPPGLSLDPANGKITGTPESKGRFVATVNATLSNGTTVTQRLRIHIFRPVPALAGPVSSQNIPAVALERGSSPSTIDLAPYFLDPDVSQAARITFNTGTIDFAFFPEAAPQTVANFTGYITRNDYLNTIIHRSVPGFVLQGGGYKSEPATPSITRQPPVPNEPEITNARGTVAMAKLGGDPDSATSEFFISLADNASNLNNQNEGFTVFARVAGNGMQVADAIAALEIRNYSSVNSVLSACPVTNPPPPAFSTDSLVKVLAAGPVHPLSFSAESLHPAICNASITGTSLSLSPLAEGTATIRITARDLDGLTTTSTLNVTVNLPFQQWIASEGLSGPDADPHADPDKDGRPNLLEYAFLTPASSTNSAYRPMPTTGTTLVEGQSYLTLAFPARLFTGGLVYRTETAPSPAGPWSTIWNSSTDGFQSPLVVASTPEANAMQTTVRDAVPITPGSPRFLRLRVSLP